MVKEKNQTKIRPSLSTMILIGLGLGMACGIFFGEYCGFLSIIGDTFIQLLQMTILPYIVASLILGIGGFSYKQAKLLAFKGGIVMLLFWVISFINVLLISGLPLLCFAQELEPRRWGHLPIGINFLSAGYSYTRADIFFDPVLRIEDAEMEMHSWGVKYTRAFELFKKSARIDFTQGYQEGRWHGLLNGAPASIKRSGLSDSILRIAINLYGAPPLETKEFKAYRARVDVETIFGTALVVHLPTGDYMSDKLINLGTNRFTFRPQLGMVHNRGKWSMD